MKRVAFVIYRQWSYEIFTQIVAYQKVRQDFVIEALIFANTHEAKRKKDAEKGIPTYTIDPNDTKKLHSILKKHKVEIVFLYSWSFIVREPVLSDFMCLCLHPSPVPRYRGGTPIQHQLVDGKKESRITIFRMNDVIDGGAIYKSAPISLLGTIDDIFARMVDVGILLTKDLLTDYANNTLILKPQTNLAKFPAKKRRTPAQSEVNFAKLQTISFEKLNNLVRGLLPPYPTVFIQFVKQTLFIKEVAFFTALPKSAIVINGKSKLERKQNLFLKIKNGYVKVVDYVIKNNS